ncbi:MAG: DUF1553 domain-containing protein [Planctomycetales bacterium]|nr:DUF1553 domain-containing protein [Planctomycetales bacterium]
MRSLKRAVQRLCSLLLFLSLLSQTGYTIVGAQEPQGTASQSAEPQSAESQDAASESAEQRLAAELRGIATNIQFNQDDTVRLLRFSKANVSDEHLLKASAFSRLDYLAVVCPQVTDAGIAAISCLRNLDTLLLSESGVSDAGLQAIAGMARLERLYLDATEIGDEGLRSVGKLDALRTLSLVDTRVGDSGLAHLAGLRQLETLRLDGTAVTDLGLAELAPLESLQSLYLSDCAVAELTAVERLPQLKYLNLHGTTVSDSSLVCLGRCAALQAVEITSTQCTPEGIRRLRAARPELKVFADAAPEVQRTPPSAVPRRDLTSDGLTSDGLTSDGPTSDGPTSDGPTSDGPRAVLASVEQRLQSTTVVPGFQRHVVPLLGRLGCNSRTCHGSFQGQGGFRLSMFGYDFERDHQNLSERLNVEQVEESLVLHKPTSADEHEGGQRLPPGGWEQQLLRNWIAAGAPGQSSPSRRFVRLEVSPEEIVFDQLGDSIPLRCVAVWSDGTREDVTCLTRFESKDDARATVTAAGRVRSLGEGQTHIIAGYDHGMVAVPVILPSGRHRGADFPQVAVSTKVDELIVAKLRLLGIVPSAVSSDTEFLRRLSLDLTGTLPLAEEVLAFSQDTSPDKRMRKVDELLEREAYVAWWTNLLCDLTGSNAGYLGATEMAQPVAAQWRSWIELRVRKNVGWDKIAEGIITASSRRRGQNYADFVSEQSSYTRPGDDGFAALGNPLPHFWYRDNITTAADKALAFGYIFMGVRLDCAQCHKHPFDRWSQKDFEQFAQFFTRVQKGVAPDAANMHENLRSMLGVPVKLNTAALRRQSYLRVAAEGRLIPWNEIYISPPGDEPHIAKFLGAEEIDLNRYEDPRQPLFQWLLHEPNHYLARSFVNRVWAHYFNVGIIDPPDDLNLANPPSNRALLDYLTQAFIDSGYDMQWLHRTIVSSDAYQRSWVPSDDNRRDEQHYSHAIVRRLPAEVVIDAMLQATADDETASQLALNVEGRKIAQHPVSYQTRAIDYSLLIFGKPLRTTNCDCERQNEPTLVQSLYLRNDDEIFAALDRPRGWLAQLAREDTGQADTGRWVESAYLRVLSRLPKESERRLGQQYLSNASSPLDGLRDLLWALLNTQEFVTNH